MFLLTADLLEWLWNCNAEDSRHSTHHWSDGVALFHASDLDLFHVTESAWLCAVLIRSLARRPLKPVVRPGTDTAMRLWVPCALPCQAYRSGWVLSRDKDLKQER